MPGSLRSGVESPRSSLVWQHELLIVRAALDSSLRRTRLERRALFGLIDTSHVAATFFGNRRTPVTPGIASKWSGRLMRSRSQVGRFPAAENGEVVPPRGSGLQEFTAEFGDHRLLEPQSRSCSGGSATAKSRGAWLWFALECLGRTGVSFRSHPEAHPQTRCWFLIISYTLGR